MKNELRKKYLLIRKNIENKEKLDSIIYHKVIKNNKVLNCETILIYVSKKDEIDTLKLIKYFLKSKRVAVPKIENKEMNFYYIECLDDLEKGYYGILEPITKNKVINFENAILITPGICFTKTGYRIGYGGGFYDKFLSKINIYSIGLCYKKCLIDSFDISNYDKNVNEIITEYVL